MFSVVEAPAEAPVVSETKADEKAEEKAAVPAEPEEPPTKTLEEFKKEQAAKMVAVTTNVRTSRNDGFKSNDKLVKAPFTPAVSTTSKAGGANETARKAISLDEFAPAPERKERTFEERPRREDGERGGRGRGEGRGRGRGRGDGRSRGRGQPIDLTNDKMFPKPGQ
jgi:plasminogen activator inhibitor 1 RNA-binding protein